MTVGKPIMNVVKELQALRFETDHQEKEIAASIAELVALNQNHEGRIVVLEHDVNKSK